MYSAKLYQITVHIGYVSKCSKYGDMAVNAQKIKEKVRLKGETNKVRVGMYLDKDLYKAFQAECGNLSISQTIEELMREFIDSAKGKK